MMKTSKYLTVALAAMAFASCGNNDEPGNENGGTQDNVLESITVKFVGTPSTYAGGVEQEGVATENSIYHAFIFAKEASPEHPNAANGDWTVVEVGALDATNAIAAGSTTGNLGNIATFKGVEQGSSVYVIANDPTMTTTKAQNLAHQGANSEAAIKAYTTELSKEYLNSLVLKATEQPTKKFVMAGMASIPTTPAVNNTVTVPVTLDRELAKVAFTGRVTDVKGDAAFGKVEIKKEAGAWGTADGLIIVRIPRKVSFFTNQQPAWYYPLEGSIKTMDWGVDAGGKEWPAFAGETDKTPGVTGTPVFNNVPYNDEAEAAEYRYTWLIGGNDAYVTFTDETNLKMLHSPTFYVTPNLTNSVKNSTLVVLQATYVGATTIMPEFTAEVMTELKITKNTEDFWDETKNLTALLSALKGYTGSDEATKKVKDLYGSVAAGSDLVHYKKNQKIFYTTAITNANITGSMATDRNTQYFIKGTITTLGTNSLDDAITSDAVGMVVEVSVNKWKYVATNVNM